MAELTKEKLEQAAKEKAELAKKIATEAAEKVKNMSADDAKELAKEKAEEATKAAKAAKEAAEKLKNMSADDAKKLAQEKLDSMKSLDNSSKMKYGGIALLVILVLTFIFSGSSYDEEFIKSQVAKKGMVVTNFDIEGEEDIEFMGRKGKSLVLSITYKAEAGKVLCQYDFLRKAGFLTKEKMKKNSITTVKTEEECSKLEYSNGKVTNAKVISSLEKIKTIVFGKEDIMRWEANQK